MGYPLNDIYVYILWDSLAMIRILRDRLVMIRVMRNSPVAIALGSIF